MKKSIQSIAVLTVICVVTAVLLALVNGITAPIIAKAEAEKANEALLVVMPDGEGFEEISADEYELPSSITNIYREKNGGYVFKMATTGYSSGLAIMCGIDKDGKITGAVCLSSGETLGYEKTYGDSFIGLDSESADSVDIISGATKTTAAYKNAVKDALASFIIVNGGSVDIRTKEEILQDNLSAVLPAGKEFTKEFITESLGDVTAIYMSGNGEGYVVAIGELFIGIDKNGNAVSEADESAKEKAIAAYNIHVNSTLEEIELSGYEGISSKILKAYKTSGGNFVFDIKASGYGMSGEWAASGKPIKIKVSASDEGKIISCITVSQSETEGIGSVCAEPSYYEQYNGKTEASLGEVDAISGATYTHKGYSSAVSEVFKTINILKGAE